MGKTPSKLLYWLLWLGFIGYAVVLAPPDRPDTADLIVRLSTGAWQGINPITVALFNAMGLWPVAYAAVALVDGQGQPLRAWPFVVASFALGAFALLPYLALRQPQPRFLGQPNGWGRWLEARWLGAGLGAAAVALALFALTQGDWPAFWQQWQTSRFIHVMALDFCALTLLFPVLMADDLARRGATAPWAVPAVLGLPLVGACGYLALRPDLDPAPGPADDAPE